MTVSNRVYSGFAGTALVLSVIPLAWHRTVATCAYMIWTALGCLVYFVDSIVWNGNTVNWAPRWCDISIRIKLAIGVAWPACVLCIVRRLHNITRASTASFTKAEKRNGIVFDLLIAVGLPILQLPLEYITASHRFDILEDYGCGGATHNTPLAFVLVYSWPLLIALISACYGALTIHALLKRRKESRALIAAKSNLSYSCYSRLVALCSLDFCFTIPLATWGIVGNATGGVDPWTSFAEVHKNFSKINYLPRSSLETNPGIVYAQEVLRWVAVFAAFAFFGFFGFGEEARRNYRLFASSVAGKLGYTILNESTSTRDLRTVNLSLQFASQTSTAQQTRTKGDSVTLGPDTLSSSTGDHDLEALSGLSPAHKRVSVGPNRVVTPIDEFPRGLGGDVPDSAWVKKGTAL